MTPPLPWFPCYPSKLLGALSGMKPDEGYLYWIVCLRIYETGHACRDTIDALVRRSGMNKRRVNIVLESLLAAGKLVRQDNGIMNPFASEVMAEANAIRETRKIAGKNGASRRWEKTKEKQSPLDSKANADPIANDGHLHLHLQEQKESKKESKKDSRSVQETRPDIEKNFNEFWNSFPKRDGSNPKAPAHKIFANAVRSGNDAMAIVSAAKSYADAETKLGHIGTPYIAQAVTWLRQSRWADYSSTGPPGGTISKFEAPPGCETMEEYKARWERENNAKVEGAPIGRDAGMGQDGSDRSSELQLSGGGACRRT